jgi:hypothetical protein
MDAAAAFVVLAQRAFANGRPANVLKSHLRVISGIIGRFMAF